MSRRASEEERAKLPVPDFGNIPDDLRDLDQWVLWRLEYKEGKAKPDKVPYDPNTGLRGDTTDPSNWGGFEQVRERYESFDYDGIGLVLKGAHTGVDLDHVLEPDGALKAGYRWIVEEADTYTEVSPSGDGLHLFFLGGKPEGVTRCSREQRDGCKVEMYDSGRFLTVTGRLFTDGAGEIHDDVRANDETLRAIHDKYLAGKPPQPVKPTATQGGQAEDDETILRAMTQRNGGMKRLMDGDTSALAKGGGVDDSAVDWSVAMEIAKYTRNPSQVERIMRGAFGELARPKWDDRRGGTTYLARTAERAVQEQTEVYVFGAEAPSIHPWYVDGAGRLWRAEKGKGSEDGARSMVSSTPPYVLAHVEDVEDGRVRELVGFKVGGVEKEVVLEHAELFSKWRIVDSLGAFGANVSTTNASQLVAYITRCEQEREDVPTYKSTHHMGWSKGKPRMFMPYDADVNGTRFDALRDMAYLATPFLQASGKLEEWAAEVAECKRASVSFRAMVAAGFASPLLEILRLRSFTVYNHGDSGTGKSTNMKVSGSIYGNPDEMNGYFGKFSDSDVTVFRRAAFLHTVPLLLDELQTMPVYGARNKERAKQQNAEKLLYDLSQGYQPNKSERNGAARPSGSWRLIVLATGEIPITTSNTQQGARNRVLEVKADGLLDASRLDDIRLLVESNYGTAGRAYIKWLQGADEDDLVRRWLEFRDGLHAGFGRTPQTDMIALLAFADAVSALAVFDQGAGWERALDDARVFAYALLQLVPSAEDRDTARQGIYFLADWIAANQAHFITSGTTPMGEVYGKREYDGTGATLVHVISTRLGDELARGGFDRNMVVTRMAREGIVQPQPDGYTHTVRNVLDRAPARVVTIDMDALDRFMK